MSRTKSVGGLALVFDLDRRRFTVDEFLNLVKDLVELEIKHGRLEERLRELQVGVLMEYWHREPYIEPGEVIPIKQSP